MNSRTFCLVLSALCTLGVAQTGCSSEQSSQTENEVGTLKMPLTATSTSGATYRLRNATLAISGTEEATILSEDHLNQQGFTVDLAAGDYVLSLAEGWSLEKIVGGAPEPVDAVLTSENPAPFVISDQQYTYVNFIFQAGDDVIQLGDGRLVVGVIVEDGVAMSENDPVSCQDGLDNDGDTYVDCQDFDCSRNFPDVCVSEPENTAAACGDMVDNDFDGFVDCQDFDCSMNFPDLCGNGEPEDHPVACEDGIDNDLDGTTDCWDSECEAIGIVCPPEPENTAAACADGIDNDQDGFIDCVDFNCRDLGVAICPVAPENTPAACTDGIDNDLDGFIDCIDFNCTGVVPECP